MQSDSPRSARLIFVALLVLATSACSDSPRTGTASRQPAPGSAQPATASAAFAGPAPAESAGTLVEHPARPSSDAAGPPPSTREIRGYFTSTATSNSLRLWKGPNDQGLERLTRFTVEIDGMPEYSRAVSTVRLAGVCRSPGKGLDQLLLSFHPERLGGGAIGVLRYDTHERRFKLGFAPKDARIDCAGGRSLFSEGTPALPCTCPWWDGPDDRSRGAAAVPADARDILIQPEENGGPAFTREETGSLPEAGSRDPDRR